VIDRGEQRGLAPEAAALDDVSAKFESRAARECILEVRPDDLRLTRHDEGADLSGWIIASELHGGQLREQALAQRWEKRTVHVNAFQRLTGLSGREYRGAQHRRRRPLKISVGGDDHRILAAELEKRRYESSCGVLGHEASGTHAAGEHDCINMIDKLGAGAAGALHDARYGGDLRHCSQHFAEGQCVARRDFAGLQHDPAAGEQRRDRVDHRQHERKVPRRDYADHGVRHELHPTEDPRGHACLPRRGREDLCGIRTAERNHPLHAAEFDLRDALPSRVGGEGCDERSGMAEKGLAEFAQRRRSSLAAERGPRGLSSAHCSTGRGYRLAAADRQVMIDESAQRIADGASFGFHA